MTCWRDFYAHVLHCPACKRVRGKDAFILCPEGVRLHDAACQKIED